MTAGSVAVPTIIPLKVIGGRKYTVDTTTPIELKSAAKEATVFYTLDGYRPNPFNLKRLGQPSTFVYKAPFTLPVGKTTIRAVALSGDGCFSSCVTKTFVVLQTGSIGSGEVVSETVQAAASHLLSHQQPYNKPDSGTRINDGVVSPSVPNSPSSPSDVGTSVSSPAVSPSSGQDTSPRRGQEISPPRGQATPPGREQEASVPVDKYVCTNCWMPYSEDSKYKFCPHCGHLLSPATQGSPVKLSQVAPFSTMHPTSGGGDLVCSTCGQTNAPGVRFCNWCGSRSDVPGVAVSCQSCLASIDSCSRYCHCCGAVVKAPARQSTYLSSHQKSTVGTQVDVITEAPPTVSKTDNLGSVSTQTEELVACKKAGFTKKSKESSGFTKKSKETSGFTKKSKETSGFTKKSKETSPSLRSKVVDLRTYSPGKGLWRVQVEHIVNHLKAHSKSSDEFQANIGNFEMGKLLHACAATNQDAKELSVNLTFALKHEEVEHKVQTAAAVSKQPDSSLVQDDKPRGGQVRCKAPDPHLLVNNQLVAELSSPHEAKCDVIHHLLEQGASVNAITEEGVPVLSLAVNNGLGTSGCFRCIEALVQGGASLGAQAKWTGNSALHEAVMKGPQAKNCIELLLKLGADPRLKNRLGQSPCELAGHLGHKELVRLFASHVAGQLIRAEIGSLRLHT